MTGDRRDTPLAAILKARIADAGPITIAEYLDACLQHPQHGYYRTHSVGRDFITAPEISQVFGELIGLWAVVVWQQMGQPRPIRLVELGPGHGTMMRDVLRAARVVPDFLHAADVHLVETSVALAARQLDLLRDTGVPVWVHGALDDVAPGAAIVIGNEFLDALPAHQYVRTQSARHERTVGLDERGDLQFDVGPAVDVELDQRFPDSREGDIVQVHSEFGRIAGWMQTRATDAAVAALFVDYGHTTPLPGDTLEAARAHRPEHPLTSPGEADLTVHIDFESVARAFGRHRRLAVDGPITQAEFLGALGIAERASRLMAANPTEANAIEMGVQRLMAPQAMGTRFKAIGIRSHGLPALPGLTTEKPWTVTIAC
jgi:NADH dehydrogenase [ubiquinone] 1 alpha subcomplex assembly factor 7